MGVLRDRMIEEMNLPTELLSSNAGVLLKMLMRLFQTGCLLVSL